MMDGAIMEFVKWFIGIISIAFVTMVVVFLFKLNEVNGFQQEVNYQVERHGGLTESALIELNDVAKRSYGGCIVVSHADGAECLMTADRGTEDTEGSKSSGFFVSEVRDIEDGSGQEFFIRSDDDQARYGENIDYALTRQIGSINGVSFLKPMVMGESASRVRGAAE